MSTFDHSYRPSLAAPTCPPWCTSPHNTLGEENWLHVGEPLLLTDGVRAQLCTSIDPLTGTQDGPYVIIGDTNYTPAQAQLIAARLVALSTGAGLP